MHRKGVQVSAGESVCKKCVWGKGHKFSSTHNYFNLKVYEKWEMEKSYVCKICPTIPTQPQIALIILAYW